MKASLCGSEETRAEATAANDRRIVGNSFLDGPQLLQLRRTPEQELKLFIDELHNPQSPNFHQWLTAEQFGERFGLAQEDLDVITHWLPSDASDLPAGVSASLSPSSATTTSKVTLKVGTSAALGTSTVTITGKSGSLSHTTTISLTLTRR